MKITALTGHKFESSMPKPEFCNKTFSENMTQRVQTSLPDSEGPDRQVHISCGASESNHGLYFWTEHSNLTI